MTRTEASLRLTILGQLFGGETAIEDFMLDVVVVLRRNLSNLCAASCLKVHFRVGTHDENCDDVFARAGSKEDG